MGRVVFSFSLPEESEAAWMLRQYKREGKVLSHVIQKAIECDFKELDRLEKVCDRWERVAERRRNILQNIFGVIHTDFNFRIDDEAYPPEQDHMLAHHQPIESLRAARDGLKRRTEWALNGGWDS